MTINKVQCKISKKSRRRPQFIERGIAKAFRRNDLITSIEQTEISISTALSKSIAWEEVDSEEHDKDDSLGLKISRSNFLTKRIFRYLASKIKGSLFMKLFFMLLIPSFAILYSTIVTLWPQHNVILHPEYGYEPIAPFLLGYIFIVTATGIVDCSMVLRSDFVLSWKAFFTIFMAHSAGFLFPYLSIYFFWVHLDYRYPMPFTGHVCYLVGSLFKGMQLWFYFPSRMRTKNKDFRKRLLAYLSFFPLQILLAQGLSLLEMLFFMVPLDMQFLLGILLPVVKKFNLWWTSEIAFRAAGGKENSARVAMICWISCTHSLWIALMINKVTFETAYLLMVFDSAPNLFLFAKIIRLRGKIDSSKPQEQKTYAESEITMDSLALKELFEVLATVSVLNYLYHCFLWTQRRSNRKRKK